MRGEAPDISKEIQEYQESKHYRQGYIREKGAGKGLPKEHNFLQTVHLAFSETTSTDIYAYMICSACQPPVSLVKLGVVYIIISMYNVELSLILRFFSASVGKRGTSGTGTNP